MSRFSEGYGDNESILAYGRWLARTRAVLKGAPGRAKLKELLNVLEALPPERRRLVENKLVDETTGDACALGQWLLAKREDQGRWKPLAELAELEDDLCHDAFSIAEEVRGELGTTETLAELVQWQNDEVFGSWLHKITPEDRYTKMVEWLRKVTGAQAQAV